MQLTRDMLDDYYRKTGHGIFGPSSMKRRQICPASAAEEATAPVPPTSEFAARGTELHEYCEQAYRKMPENPIRWINESDLDEEGKVLCIDAIGYVEQVKALHVDPSMTFETHGSLASWGIPEVEGTCDVIIISANRIDVLDYKFGRGVQVFAEDNLQCACYLATTFDDSNIIHDSTHNEFDPDNPVSTDYFPTMVVHIVQPTLNHFDAWEIHPKNLQKIIFETVSQIVDNCFDPDPPYKASMEACRFCNVNQTCKHRIGDTGKKIAMVRETRMQLNRDPSSISKEKWREFLDNADDIQQAIKDGRAYAHAEIESGRGFPGYKLIAGRSNRVFKDQEAGENFIKEKLGAKAFAIPKVITLAQAEKVLPGLKKMGEWKDMITKPTGKAVLVPEDDKRPALQFKMQNEFDQLAETTGNVDAESHGSGAKVEIDDMFK